MRGSVELEKRHHYILDFDDYGRLAVTLSYGRSIQCSGGYCKQENVLLLGKVNRRRPHRVHMMWNMEPKWQMKCCARYLKYGPASFDPSGSRTTEKPNVGVALQAKCQDINEPSERRAYWTLIQNRPIKIQTVSGKGTDGI